jgi:osmoprotectant transport system permease protein
MGLSPEIVLRALLQHLGLTAVALLLAVVIGVPLGIHLARERFLARPVLTVIGVIQTIPTVALVGFLIPIFGIGLKPAVIALFLYSLLPVVLNTYTGIDQVDRAAIEAARGIGMRDRQILFRVMIPQALPVLMAGVRTATVLCVGVATLAAVIGAGGLGTFIFAGVDTLNSRMVLAGAVPAAVLALALDWGLALLERWITPAGLRKG